MGPLVGRSAYDTGRPGAAQSRRAGPNGVKESGSRDPVGGGRGGRGAARLAPARLLALLRVVALRRVDADVADLLDPVAEPDVDRVAVHDADDGALESSRLDGGGGNGEGQENR